MNTKNPEKLISLGKERNINPEYQCKKYCEADTAKPILYTSPRVFVTGFFDLLNSGHVQFLREAAEYGDLCVGIGSDQTFEQLKGRKPVCSEQERLYMVKAVRYVADAFIMEGGHADRRAEGAPRPCPLGHQHAADLDRILLEQSFDLIEPDVFVVNTDDEAKRELCEARGIEYVCLETQRCGGAERSMKVSARGAVSAATPQYDAIEGSYCEADTELRSDTAKPILKKDTAKPILSKLPYRIDVAGTWIDQPYVSEHGPGWAITASIEPTYEFMERGGMSTSTRNAAKKIWPVELPAYNEEMLARLLFCFENDPENEGHVSGAQDAIGICISGLSRHYYNGHYWPERIETIHDEDVLSWLEGHVCVVPMFPRRPGCSVVEGKDITPEKVQALTEAASQCWDAILNKNLQAFADAFRASFEAQIAMFPAMMQLGVQDWIDEVTPHALAWKMLGAGGGGNLLLVVEEIPDFAIPVKIRRRD